MPVFLSHRSTDTDLATSIYNYMGRHGIKCYIDKLDESLQSTADITAVILKRIDECSHMMAVLSDQTQGSWWVPFELGAASNSDRRISSFKTTAYLTLPEYLTKWPVMKDQSDLDKFIELYKHDSTIGIFESRSSYQNIKTADQFHRTLKQAIG